MKKGIHPQYFPNAKVICSCGNTWTTGSTQEVVRTDVCSACHPFFTGEQRIVDTAGQVDRFMKRLEQYDRIRVEEKDRGDAAEKKARRRARRAIIEVSEEPPSEAVAEETAQPRATRHKRPPRASAEAEK
jgi:large subunit ribosomal protein L31